MNGTFLRKLHTKTEEQLSELISETLVDAEPTDGGRTTRHWKSCASFWLTELICSYHIASLFDMYTDIGEMTLCYCWIQNKATQGPQFVLYLKVLIIKPQHKLHVLQITYYNKNHSFIISVILL